MNSETASQGSASLRSESDGAAHLEHYGWPEVTSLEDANFWLRVMHRRTCDDARRLYEVEERLRLLERPWWRRFGRG